MGAETKQKEIRSAINNNKSGDTFLNRCGARFVACAVAAAFVLCPLIPYTDGAAAQIAEEAAAPDLSWPTELVRDAEYSGGVRRLSYYVPMRDGVRLAVGLWLPAGLAGEAAGSETAE